MVCVILKFRSRPICNENDTRTITAFGCDVSVTENSIGIRTRIKKTTRGQGDRPLVPWRLLRLPRVIWSFHWYQIASSPTPLLCASLPLPHLQQQSRPPTHPRKTLQVINIHFIVVNLIGLCGGQRGELHLVLE